MPNNSFKELENEDSKKFEERNQRVRDNINHSVGFFHFLGDILDLFLPKVVNMFLTVSGGKGPKTDSNSGEASSDDDNPNRPKYPNSHE